MRPTRAEVREMERVIRLYQDAAAMNVALAPPDPREPHEIPER